MSTITKEDLDFIFQQSITDLDRINHLMRYWSPIQAGGFEGTYELHFEAAHLDDLRKAIDEDILLQKKIEENSR